MTNAGVRPLGKRSRDVCANKTKAARLAAMARDKQRERNGISEALRCAGKLSPMLFLTTATAAMSGRWGKGDYLSS